MNLSNYPSIVAGALRDFLTFTALPLGEAIEFLNDNSPPSFSFLFTDAQDIEFTISHGVYRASVLTSSAFGEIEAKSMRGLLSALIVEAEACGDKWTIHALRNRNNDR